MATTQKKSSSVGISVLNSNRGKRYLCRAHIAQSAYSQIKYLILQETPPLYNKLIETTRAKIKKIKIPEWRTHI